MSAAAPAARSPDSPAQPGWLVWLALGTVYIVWGSTYLAIRVMVRTLPPLLAAGARFFVAGLVLALVLRLRRGHGALRLRPAELAGAAVVGTLLTFGGNGLVSVGEQHVPSSLAALLIAAVPLWVVVLRPLIGEHTGRGALVGILAGFAGVALLLLPGAHPAGARIGSMLLIVLASLCWASGSVGSRRLPTPPDAFVSTAVQMLCGGALMAIVGLASGEAGRLHSSEFTLDAILALAYLVVFGSWGAFTAYVWLLQNAPMARVATYAYVNPVVAVLLGWLILAEPISPITLVAAALIVASVAVTVRHDGRRVAGALAARGAAQTVAPDPSSARPG